MEFGGIQKVSLLDYPGKIACTLFTNGCNMRCPFCHNASLVHGQGGSIPEEQILAFLNRRRGLLDGVCITGGEPLLHPGLPDFARKVRNMGFLIKLDTNGLLPDALSPMLALVDYIAMDIKNSRAKYALTCGADINISDIEKSVSLIMSSGIPYEFRTTVVREFHSAGDFADIAHLIKGSNAYFLQQFTDSGELLSGGLHGYSNDEMNSLFNEIKDNFDNISLRGIN